MFTTGSCWANGLCLLALFIAVLLREPVSATPIPKLKLVPPVPCNATTNIGPPLCGFDEREMCMRQYKSQCHLNFAACASHIIFTDYKAEYCAMLDGFMCEGDFERWTIFFGHEKELKGV